MESKYKVAIALLLVLGFLAVGNTITFPHTAMVTKVIQEPYTVQEPYQVAVDKDLSYTISGNAFQDGGFEGLNWITYGKVPIENQDTSSGTFVVSCNFRTVYRTLTDTARLFLNPGESKYAVCRADTDLGENVVFTYSITPGTKTVFETHYRDVTKYRDKQIQEPQTLYQTLFQSWGLVS